MSFKSRCWALEDARGPSLGFGILIFILIWCLTELEVSSIFQPSRTAQCWEISKSWVWSGLSSVLLVDSDWAKQKRPTYYLGSLQLVWLPAITLANLVQPSALFLGLCMNYFLAPKSFHRFIAGCLVWLDIKLRDRQWCNFTFFTLSWRTWHFRRITTEGVN